MSGTTPAISDSEFFTYRICMYTNKDSDIIISSYIGYYFIISLSIVC